MELKITEREFIAQVGSHADFKKVLVVGMSGSGKSRLADMFRRELSVLDLDRIGYRSASKWLIDEKKLKPYLKFSHIVMLGVSSNIDSIVKLAVSHGFTIAWLHASPGMLRITNRLKIRETLRKYELCHYALTKRWEENSSHRKNEILIDRLKSELRSRLYFDPVQSTQQCKQTVISALAGSKPLYIIERPEIPVKVLNKADGWYIRSSNDELRTARLISSAQRVTMFSPTREVRVKARELVHQDVELLDNEFFELLWPSFSPEDITRLRVLLSEQTEYSSLKNNKS